MRFTIPTDVRSVEHNTQRIHPTNLTVCSLPPVVSGTELVKKYPLGEKPRHTGKVVTKWILLDGNQEEELPLGTKRGLFEEADEFAAGPAFSVSDIQEAVAFINSCLLHFLEKLPKYLICGFRFEDGEETLLILEKVYGHKVVFQMYEIPASKVQPGYGILISRTYVA